MITERLDDEQDKSLSERKIFDLFVRKLVEHDQDRNIYESLWSTFSGPIRTWINNQYVFQPFWEAHRLGHNENDWKLRFERAKHAANHYLATEKVPELLGMVLDRLYVLRNQLMHGGVTYQSRISRDQGRDGRNMLAFLMPLIVEILEQSATDGWGDIYYPVVS